MLERSIRAQLCPIYCPTPWYEKNPIQQQRQVVEHRHGPAKQSFMVTHLVLLGLTSLFSLHWCLTCWLVNVADDVRAAKHPKADHN